jgi:uncharacterized glyoxalase superfamily protein PhnB
MIFTPALVYRDPKAAIAWLERAFGFELTMLIESPDGDANTLHAEMKLGGQGLIMIGGEWSEWARSPASAGGANTQSVHVDLEGGIDAHCERARSAGAVVLQEPQDQFYGQRTYRARDPEGHVWNFSQVIRQVSKEEMESASGLRLAVYREE